MWRQMTAWAQSQGWRCEPRRVSGVYGGYRLTVLMIDNARFRVATPAHGLTDEARARLTRFFAANGKFVQRYDLAGAHCGVIVRKAISGASDRTLVDFVVALTGELAAAGVAGKDHCAVCGAVGEHRAVWVKSIATPMCGDCQQRVRALQERVAEEEAAKPRKYGAGAVGALLGALIGALPWVGVGQLGYQAAILGALIGVAAMFGYTRFGGRAGKATPWIIGLSTLIGVVAAELASIAIFFNKNEYAISLYNYTIMYTEPELARTSWTNLGFGLLMAGLGVWRIIANLVTAARGGGETMTPAD